MTNKIFAMAAKKIDSKITPFEYSFVNPLHSEEVEIAIEYCGLCHSDLSMLKNEWGITQYPFVPGHEIVGKIIALGDNVKNLKIGQRVGIGWFAGSCMGCNQCLSGSHNLCSKAEQTIVGRYGGFATRVRSHWLWAIPLPENIDFKNSGPLFCGGITVFNPLLEFEVKPTDRVAVLGIGGLGHLAIQFLHKFGCEVSAFTSNSSKHDEIRALGANYVYNTRDPNLTSVLNSKFNFILNTTNVDLDWNSYFTLLAPKGRLHSVGAVPGPISVSAFALITKQNSLSGSPLGSPATINKMLEFVERHDIKVKTEHFPMSQAQEAMDYLQKGNPKFRIVLKNDLD